MCVLSSNAVIQSWTVSISLDSQDSPDRNPYIALCHFYVDVPYVAYDNVFHNFAKDACE